MRSPSFSSSPSICLQLPHRPKISLTEQASYLARHCLHPASHSSGLAQSRGRPIASGESSLRRREERQKAGSWKLLQEDHVSGGGNRWHFVGRLLPHLRGSQVRKQCWQAAVLALTLDSSLDSPTKQIPQRVFCTGASKRTRRAIAFLWNSYVTGSGCPGTRDRANKCSMTQWLKKKLMNVRVSEQMN